MPRNVKKIVIPLLIIIGSIVLFYVLQMTKPEKRVIADAKNFPIVSVETLSASSASAQLNLIGQVVSQDVTPLLSPAEMFVQEVSAQVGQYVKKDQLLVRLDRSELRLQEKQLQADIQALEGEIENLALTYEYNKKSLANEQTLRDIAKRNVTRAEKLAKSQAGSQAALDSASEIVQQRMLAWQARKQAIDAYEIQKTSAQARLARAQANLELLQIELARADVSAPFDGYVTQLNVAKGQRVNRNSVILQMYKHGSLELKAQFPLRYTSLLSKAVSNNKTVYAQALPQNGENMFTLMRVAAQVSANQAGVDAYFAVPDDAALRLGETLEVRATLPAIENAFTLPMDALYERDQIYLVNDGVLNAYQITRVGQFVDETGKTRVIVQHPDLKAGQQVLTSRLPQAINGLQVQLAQSQ